MQYQVLTLRSIQFVLINRFIINLRRARLQSEELNSSVGHVSTPSGLRFRLPTIAGVIGDMGQPLEHGARAEDNDSDLWRIDTESGEEAFPFDMEHRRSPVMA